jgi:dTDP-4-dehydrorhamnose reductase
MRVLLTGGTGQIGTELRPKLAQLGEVIAPDRATMDLAQPSEIGQVLDRLAPDFIVSCGAYTAVDQAEDEVALAFAVNADAPAALARWAAGHMVPILHFSTDYVFDGSGLATMDRAGRAAAALRLWTFEIQR